MIGNYLTLIYPIAIVAILLFGMKLYSGKGQFFEHSWERSQSKSLQAVAALMIIVHHMAQTITKYGDIDKGPITEFNSFGILFTSIFFFFSGFGLYVGYRDKENYIDGFLKRHLPKLLVAFYITNIIYIVVLGVDRITSALDLFTSLIGLTLINTNAWFLVELIILYIAFYLCFRKNTDDKKAFWKMGIAVAMLVIFSMLLGHDNTQINGHWFMGEWWYNTTVLFFVGMLFARYESIIKNFIKKHYGKLLMVSIVAFIIWYFAEEYILDNLGYYQEWRWHMGYPEKLVTLIAQIILCVLFMWILLLANMKVEFHNKVITFLGSISFEIYLIHDIFRQMFYRKGKMPDAEYMGLTIVFTILLGWGLSKIHALVTEFCIEHSKQILCIKKAEPDTELSYEARQRFNNISKVIFVFKMAAAGIVLGFIITFGLWVYDNTIVPEKEYEIEMNTLENAQVGDTVCFGKWVLDYKAGEMESISWKVMDEKDGYVLLLADKVLANESYHDKHENVEWKDSRLCRILNHDFYNDAFSAREKDSMCTRYAYDGNWCQDETEAFTYFINKDGEYDFEDVVVSKEFVFVFGQREIDLYLPKESDRVTTVTKAAHDQGVGNSNDGDKSSWWISEKGSGDCCAKYIDTKGNIVEKGKAINNTGMGVRPAIWVNTNR